MFDTAEPLNNSSETQPSNISPEAEKPSPTKRWQLLATGAALRLKSVAKSKTLWWGMAFGVTATVSATLGSAFGLFAPLPFVAPEYQTRSLTDILQKFAVHPMTRPVNILVMGIDLVPDAPPDSSAGLNGRSDTMLLLRLDPRNHSVTMLSIPRDTRVNNPFLSIDKINQANVDGGAALAAEIVKDTLDGVEIDRYVRVTTEAFRQLVDLVGGVEVYVPQKMQYVDETQHLKIDLQPGLQTLNGEQAEQFARFRHDQKGDIGRVQRQQLLIKALRQHLINASILPQLPQMMKVIQKYVDTNVSWEEMLSLANFSLQLDKSDIKMVMLPGRFSQPREYGPLSYWVMDEAARDRVMHDFFGLEVNQIASNTNKSENSLRIAIQNASGQPNITHRVADYLKSLGFRNTYFSRDYPETQNTTQIIVQTGDIKAAEKLQLSLRIGKIESASVGEINSDITLRVGADWTPPNLSEF